MPLLSGVKGSPSPGSRRMQSFWNQHMRWHTVYLKRKGLTSSLGCGLSPRTCGMWDSRKGRQLAALFIPSAKPQTPLLRVTSPQAPPAQQDPNWCVSLLLPSSPSSSSCAPYFNKKRSNPRITWSSLDLFPSLFCHPTAHLSQSHPFLSILIPLASHKPSNVSC